MPRAAARGQVDTGKKGTAARPWRADAVTRCLRQLAPGLCAAAARRRQTGRHDEARCAIGACALDEVEHQTPEPLTRVDPQHGAGGDCTGHHCPKNPPLGSRIREAGLLQPCLAIGVPAKSCTFRRDKPVTCIETGGWRLNPALWRCRRTEAVRLTNGGWDGWIAGRTSSLPERPPSTAARPGSPLAGRGFACAQAA